MEKNMDMAARQNVNSYKFGKKTSDMGKTFGTIKKGDEERYSFILFPMESNLLKTSRIKQINNGRRAIDAVCACLFIIDGYLNKIEYDLDQHLTDDVALFVEGLLMAFDPFVNKEILSIVNSSGMVDISSAESLYEYFKTPIKCLLRIEKSIELWTKELGASGYFTFLEKTLGNMVEKNEKMDFAIITDNQQRLNTI